ncbi:MAG: DNA recombination protein RmuC [Thermoanaerobaculia bacterium]|nr:DNA recombination protein RmuC [Thermoanaerobaculia bacterium]
MIAEPAPALLLGLLVGLCLGWVLSALWARARRAAVEERLRAADARLTTLADAEERASALRAALERERAHREADQERLAWIHTADELMRNSFRSLSAEALERNGKEMSARSAEKVGQAMAPVAKALEGLEARLRELEAARLGAYEGLHKEVALLRDAHHQLSGSTEDLRRALTASGPRGRWAEVQLRRLVELAGLMEHVDFEEQKDAQGLRPDLVIQLPGDAVLPVDAKSPMNAWLELARLDEGAEAERASLLDAHHQALRRRTAELSSKEYWRNFETAPDFVVMYLPHDGVLATVFQRDPSFLDFCVERRVLPATPVTLLALLKSVAWTWRQERLARGAGDIAAAGRLVHERLRLFLEHLAQVGRGLDGAIDSYNRAVGSLERRLMPAARRLEETAATHETLLDPEPVDRAVRSTEG